MKKTIVYIGNFSFPKSSAAGIRVLNNGYLFRSLGYEVIFIGLSKDINSADGLKSTCKEFDDFKYYEFSYPKKLTDWIFYQKQLKETIALLTEIAPTSVVAYGSVSNALFSLFLGKWCKSNNVKFITDCVDWLSGASGSFLFRMGKRIDTELQKRYVNAIGNGVITVSSFLADYYSKKGCVTLVLPPLSNKNKTVINNQIRGTDSTIKIIYAGFPFPISRKVKDKSFFKDRLDKSIELLSLQGERAFIFDIFGVTLDDYLKNVPEHTDMLKLMEGKIKFHGVVSNKEVVNQVSKADYFFLFRDSNKTTNSGFPSKISEAASLGVPAITTDTSDLSKYIKQGSNGYILRAKSIQEGVVELNHILDSHKQDHSRMKNRCMVQNPFELNHFLAETKNFMDNI
jgi:glycosyltransferase involved in cell wall biosynthesis